MFSNKTESRIQTTKKVVRFVAVKSITGTVVTVLHQNIETFSKTQKVQLYIGAALVANVVADKAWDHFEAQIDELIDVFRPEDDTVVVEDDVEVRIIPIDPS